MRSRPNRPTWSLPSGRDAAALFVLVVAAGSLAGSAWVRAEGGVPWPGRRATAPARAAAPSDCSPAVSSLSASSAPAAGGVPITIYGTNFMAAGLAPRVRVGHAVADLQSASDGELVVLVPRQRLSADASVTVELPDGRSSAPVPFAYEDAVVTPEPDASASFGGGTLLTIHGSNFACSAPRAWLDDGSGVTADCRVVEAADESLVVELPDWNAPTATLRAGVVHRDLAARNVLFDGPELTGLSPSTWPALGGTRLTITGSNFIQGGEGSRVQVLRGSRRVEAPVVSQTAGEIVAIAPELLDAGTGQSPAGVCVERGGRRSVTFQCKLDQDVAEARSLSPAGGPVAGGATITIVGDNFRSGGFLDAGGVVIVLDGLDSRRATFTLPPLPAGLHPVSVVQNGKASPPLEVEVLSPPQVFTVAPAVVPVDGRNILTISGANFGISDFGMARVVSTQQAGGPPTNAGPVRWISPEALEVVLPAGQPGPADLTVEIAGVPVTLPNAFTYSGSSPAPAPVLDSSEPAECTRLGGNVITLHGSNFGPAGSSTVIFGSTEVTPLGQTDTDITFVQPPAPESNVQNPIYVEKGAQGSNPLYQGKGAGIVSAAVSSMNGYAGGTVITITGSDFAAGARARFSAPDGATTDCRALSVTPTTLLVTAPEVDGHAWNELRVVRDEIPSLPVPYVLSGPSLAGISTRELSAGGGTVITITGSDFGLSPRLLIGTVPVARREYIPGGAGQPDQIVASFPSPARPEAGIEPLRVIGDGGAASDSFLVRWKAPELNSNSDQAVRAGGGNYLTVTGNNFGASAHLTIAGSGAFLSPPIVDRTGTELVAMLDASGPGTFQLGVVDDVLGASPPAALHLLAPPAITSVEPSTVPLAGNVILTISGANFGPPGVAVARQARLVGRDCPLEGLEVLDGTLRVTAPPGSAGPADLVVVVDGVADTIPGAFTYSATADVTPPPAAPRELALAAGPTPFRDALLLTLAIPAAGRWQLDLFDARGARVRRFEGQSRGARHELRWDGRTAAGGIAPPGVYFARLTAGGGQRITRAVKLE